MRGAEVEAPAALLHRLIGQFGPLRESGRLPFDSDREIDALRPVLESELLGPAPPAGRTDRRLSGRGAGCVRLRGRLPGRGRLRADRSLLAAGSVGRGADRGSGRLSGGGRCRGLSSRCRRLWCRWSATGCRRNRLARCPPDQALREAPRRGLFAPLLDGAWRPVRFAGSLPDGAGDQAFVALPEGGSHLAVASVVIDAGRGIGEAFIISGAEAVAVMPG